MRFSFLNVYQTRRKRDVRDVCISVRFFLYFDTLNEKRKNANIEHKLLKRQFILIRSRDRNHSSFSPVAEFCAKYSVVEICSFRKCDLSKRLVCCYCNNVLTTRLLFHSSIFCVYIEPFFCVLCILLCHILQK